MKLKRNKLYNILKTTTLVALFSCVATINADALKVTEIYELPGVASGYIDKDVPIALKVTEGGDGISAGAYLYRHKHQGVDYYAPWVPTSWVGTGADKNGTSYNTWGFWDMTVNKASHTVNSPYYYATGTIKSGGATGVNANGASAGTLPANTRIKIYGVNTSTSKVIVNANDYSQLSQGSAQSELIELSMSKVTFTGTKLSIMYDGWSSNVLLHNFKQYAKYGDNARSTHYGLTTARWTNPNRTDVPSSVRGKSGEWRYIGYNRYGDPLDNPYFVADTQSASSGHIYSATRRHTPWNKTDVQSGEVDAASAYTVFTKGMNAKSLQFEYDTQSQYSAMKDYVVDLLYAQGCIKSKSNAKNEFSLRTNAYKQGIILKNQRKTAVYYSVPFVEANNVRDLYSSRMEIWDLTTNKVIASLTSNGTSSKVTTSGQYIPGRSYEVRVRLANGTGADLIKNSVEVQYGMVYGASSISSSMTYANTTSNKQTQTQGNKAGIIAQKGDESNDFVFKFSVSSNQTGPIDVYGFVGSSHNGVDNMEYGNDTIGIRLTQGPVPSGGENCTITNNGRTKICGKGDIRPYNIQIFDTAGKQVYRHMYNESTPSIKEGLIPGDKYEIVYNAIYYGDSIMEYTWKDAINDNPNTSENEYVAGSWSAGTLKKFKIPLNFLINKYSGGPNQVDNIVSNAENNLYVYEKEGTPNYGKLISTDITLTNGTLMTFKDSYIMFQHPYLHTAFRPVPNDARINSNTNNDRMEITINDEFDIILKDLKVVPVTSYVSPEDNTIDYNVSYDAELVTPSYVKQSDYQAFVNTAISINGKEYYVKDQLVKGTDGNKNITHIIKGVSVSEGTNTVDVYLNYDKNSYENGGYDNNKGRTTATVKTIKNPLLGSPNDVVSSPDSLNSNNSNRGGDANNNCLIPRTRNTWTSTHRKYSWSSNSVTYQALSSGANITFNDYYSTYEKLNEATETYEEEFGIQKILFRSKETREKGYGNDGWINLLDSNEKNLAVIKAGYGFELKVVTNYHTDAFTKRSWSISNNGISGTAVSAGNGSPNFGLEDIFVELPGTRDTRKILSSTGFGSTTLGLNSSKNVSGNTTEWTYTIKPSNTLGIGETPKIYIPEGMKDGDYKLKIYTPPVSGVSSINKNRYSALCDRKEVTIKVKGSATDDLYSNIIQ